MPIILKEANQFLKDNMYEIPKELHKHLVQTLQQYGDGNEENKGYKRLNALVNPKYNKRSDKEDTQFKDGKHISHTDMEQIDHDFRHMSNNPNNIQRILNGGDEMAMFVKNTLNRERTKVEPVAKQKKVETRNKNATKPTTSPTKPIKVGNTMATVHECKINENITDEHPYWEKIEDYGTYFVFNSFENNENMWKPLIKPEMYEKALQEFTKYGQFINFPIKYIYVWMGIIMKNTAILRTCTDIFGHSNYVPIDDFIDFYFDGDYYEFEKYKNSININDDYNAMWEFLYRKGFDDWCKLPDGSDALSDYGIQPIEKLIGEYDENKSPEETIVIINKILDVIHCRGDLASMFIIGGSKTLSQISEDIKKTKKIHITENQLNVIKEYRNQLTIPFDGINGKYNYEHFIDWLEDIGQYGTLPSSNANTSELIKNNYNNALEEYKDRISDEEYNFNIILEQFMDYIDENNLNIFKMTKLSKEQCQEYIDNDYIDDIVLYQLNDYGQKIYNEFIEKDMSDKLYDNNFEDFKFNDRNLLYIERDIEIPEALAKSFYTYNNKHNDLYAYLIKEYENHIGQCWSWFKGGVQNSSGYYNTKRTILKLKGYVDPINVDWENTIYLNAYSLRDEKEIYVKYNSPIEIVEIIVNGKEKLPLKNSIIINS